VNALLVSPLRDAVVDGELLVLTLLVAAATAALTLAVVDVTAGRTPMHRPEHAGPR
jgi:hypothetical protein